MTLNHPTTGHYYYTNGVPTLLTPSAIEELTRQGPASRPQPIRLTRQWLTSFGFEPDASGHTWSFEDIRLVPGLNCWLCARTRRYLRFVHELQVLFEETYETELVAQQRQQPVQTPSWAFGKSYVYK
ncbi:hypothetical protein [Larkinella soli]|uniref:hypothetical protein n=1 Tax=Larkinella soli TaxID=1770527 RepID=UPI000FFC559A|nr:hypothetical protein [Larkinella soli]